MTQVIKADRQDAARPRAMAMKLSDIAERARRIVLDARKDAARIVAEARSTAEQAQCEARERGYAEGLAQAAAEASADGGADVDHGDDAELRELVERVGDELSAARESLMAGARRDVLDLAIRLAERIVGRVAARDVEAARDNLAKALELASPGAARVYVNPSQLDQLRDGCGDLLDSLGRDRDVRFEADPAISPGGVRVEAGEGEIDATIETQLDNIAEALMGDASPRRPRELAVANCDD